MSDTIKTEAAATPVKKKRTWTFLLFLAINIAIVVYIATKEFGADAMSAQNIASLDINMFYLIFAAVCFAIAVITETAKYHSMMISTEGRWDLRGAFECAVLGKYYDNVTPLGAGGQPFQIYYLKKRGFSTGSSASMPIAGFLVLQFAFIIVAAVVFIFNGSIMENVAGIRITAYIGLGFYMFIPVCIILFTIIPKTFGGMVCVVAKFLHKIHIIKDYERAVGGIFGSLDEYCGSLKLMSKNPWLIIKTLIYSIIYQVAIMSIPFFVLRAFGGVHSWWTVFSFVVYIYAAITVIPTPGNSGAAEGSFYAVFSSLTSGYLFWAMIIWRALCYYSWLALGLIMISLSAVHAPKAKEKEKIPEGPLRSAEFVDIYYPHIDGVVRTVDSYAKRLNEDGSCCVVCPDSRQGFDDSVLGYKVLRTGFIKLPGLADSLPSPFISRKIYNYFKENRFDVFHVHSPFVLGQLAIKLGRKYNVPVIATFHSKFYDDVLSVTHSKVLARIMANYVVRFFSKADEVWACSASTAETLRSYGFAGEIGVMDNGVDPWEVQNSDELRQKAMDTFSIPQGKRVLLFVGQQIWHKNLKLVLDTAKKLQSEEQSYVTVIAGQGYDGEAIKAYAKRLGLDGDVIFTGQISDKDMLQGLFQCGDLFFFPSIYDNAPLVLREAALSGLPALLAAGSNSAECVTDGVNGFAERTDEVLMAAKIRDIFDNCDLKAVGERAKETIPVGWDEIVRQVATKYRLARKRDYTPVDVRKKELDFPQTRAG